ncbi:hypothetical protein QTP86_027093, partial [Hemibagrus guttatus]
MGKRKDLSEFDEGPNSGKIDKRKDLSEFDEGQIVMARPLDQSISKTAALVGCSRLQWSVFIKSGPRKEQCRRQVRVSMLYPVHCRKRQQWAHEHQNWTTEQWKKAAWSDESLCLLVMHSHTFPDISAIVDGPVSLPCNCSGDKVEWTIFSPIKASIAECHHGVCEIKPPFNKSFSFLGNTSSGNFSISINSTRYNDLGMYRCTCNGKQVSGGKLHVYDPRIVTGVEGNITSLPCYGDTRLDAKDVQWKKDGKDLLEYTRAKPNETSAGRFSVSKQGFQDGDLSLHISSVNLSDAGFYLCLIHDESREGDPRAVVLKVKSVLWYLAPRSAPADPLSP